jgi:uncharacterized membrane protein YkvA (DUF1232 family)
MDPFGRFCLDMACFHMKEDVAILDLKARAQKLKTDIPAVFLALGRKETPRLAKVLAFLTVGYALSPIDLIPDFIPVLGYLDDLILLPALVALTVRQIPRGVMEECRAQAQTMWKDRKPRRWYYAVPIVAIWLAVLFFAVRRILRAI